MKKAILNLILPFITISIYHLSFSVYRFTLRLTYLIFYAISREETVKKVSMSVILVVNAYFNKNEDQNCWWNMTIVRAMTEFKQNFSTCLSLDVRLEATDFSKWTVVGGCVLNGLCQSRFPDTKEQDVNLVYYVNDILDFQKSIDITVKKLINIVSRILWNNIQVKISFTE